MNNKIYDLDPDSPYRRRYDWRDFGAWGFPSRPSFVTELSNEAIDGYAGEAEMDRAVSDFNDLNANPLSIEK